MDPNKKSANINTMNQKKEFQILGRKFEIHQQSGYLNITKTLKEHNKTIKEWLESEELNEKLEIFEITKFHCKVNSPDELLITENENYYLNPMMMTTFLTWVTDDKFICDLTDYLVKSGIIFDKKINEEFMEINEKIRERISK